jgi:hypothetical protein
MKNKQQKRVASCHQTLTKRKGAGVSETQCFISVGLLGKNI